MTEQLKEELEQLRQKLKAMETTQKETAKQQHHPVYIKSERKIPKLAGRPTANSDPEVDDWITDMKEHIASIPTKEGKIDFVLDHLTGSAKTEVRLRPSESKKNRRRHSQNYRRYLQISGLFGTTKTQILRADPGRK